MKLFYYQRPDGISNFGDDLNAWLWPQLMPDVLTDDPTTAFVGIGTLLNDALPQRLPQAKRLIVFSTGVGYGQPPRDFISQGQVYCVRGPLSAQLLGLPESLAIADGALLVRCVFQATGSKTGRYAWMPHVNHACFASSLWPEICQQAGLSYIDPRWPVEKVLEAISQTEALLAEAMHGAIVADTLRVPWVPVMTSPKILAFKWRDWCSSLGLDYRPYYLPPLVGSYPPLSSRRSALKYWGKCWQQGGWPVLGELLKTRSFKWAAQLRHLSQVARPQLSSQNRLDRLTEELKTRLERLIRDWSHAQSL